MIIGIDGYAGAGKDTVADILTTLGFTKVAFADHLRESVSHATGLEMNSFLDRDIKDNLFSKPLVLSQSIIQSFCDYVGHGDKVDEVVAKYEGTNLVSPRHSLQFLGTEVGRYMLDPLIWIKAYVRRIEGLKHVSTPDARFSNERECIKHLQGLVFYVEREGVGPSEDHISGNDKWDKSKYDLLIENTSINQMRHELSLWWSLVGHKK